nr:DNA repair protein RecO [Anaerolineae bacterium]
MRRLNLGEADRILTVYSRDYGKIKVLAKGVRKPSSRKAGHVELFALVDMLIARGQSLDVLSQVDLIEPYLPLRSTLVHTTYAAHFIELLDAFTEDEDPSPPMFHLANRGLLWLTVTGDLRRTARYFELAFLDLAGYRPELFRCAVCQTTIKPQDQFYSPLAGGVICPVCAGKVARVRPISLKTLKVLRYMQTRDFDLVEQVGLGHTTHVECERLLHDTLVYYLERRLRSAAFLNRLRREQGHMGNQADGGSVPGEDAALSG